MRYTHQNVNTLKTKKAEEENKNRSSMLYTMESNTHIDDDALCI